MKPKAICKIAVDVCMYVLFLLLMGQCVLRDAAHEWLGIAAAVLFLLHNALNYKWYLSFFKGKYSTMRIVQLAVNILLLCSVIGCMVSGMIVSQHIFTIGRGGTIEFGRRLHLVMTAWSFILMSVHLGLHWSSFVGMVGKIKVSNKAKKILRTICRVVVLILCLYGAYLFAERRFWEELFHLIDYQKEYDYSKAFFVYFAETAVLSSLFVTLAYYAKKLLLNIKVRRKNKHEVEKT